MIKFDKKGFDKLKEKFYEDKTKVIPFFNLINFNYKNNFIEINKFYNISKENYEIYLN